MYPVTPLHTAMVAFFMIVATTAQNPFVQHVLAITVDVGGVFGRKAKKTE